MDAVTPCLRCGEALGRCELFHRTCTSCRETAPDECRIVARRFDLLRRLLEAGWDMLDRQDLAAQVPAGPADR